MSEFIVIQVGQCGNQVGSTLWPLILKEYNIYAENKFENEKGKNTYGLSDVDMQKSLTSFFQVPDESLNKPLKTLSDLKSNNVKARVICIDMEDSVVARFKNVQYRHIFDKKNLITSYPGSGNNWAEGYYFHGPEYKDKILTRITRMVESCNSLQGFFLIFSMGGGTGSGLGTYVLNLLADHFPLVERFVACVYPTGTEDVITCPYNMVLATNELINNATCIFPVENRALLEITNKNSEKCFIGSDKCILVHKPYDDLNIIIANMLLHLTSGSRFAGNLNFDINEIYTNMVPFPNLNFLSATYGPMVHANDKIINKGFGKRQKDEIFLETCNRSNQLLQIDPLNPKSVLLGTTLIGRGDFNLTDMRGYVEKIQQKGCFTPWSSKSVKMGLCNIPPNGCSSSLVSIFNTSSVTNLFGHILDNYSKLYSKRAHIHHYTKIKGFDFFTFEESMYNIHDTMVAYKDMELSVPLEIPRLQPSNN